MKLSIPSLGIAATLVLAVAGAAPATAGESTGCWRYLGCAGAPAYGYAPPPPAYGYAPPPPAYGYAPYRPAAGYYDAPAYGGECYMVRRRFVDDWGRVVIRRTRVCE